MAMLDGVFEKLNAGFASARSFAADRLRLLRMLSPAGLKRLASQSLSDIVASELARSRKRVSELEALYPTATKRELAQRLMDGKKALAGMVGGVSGVFGLLGLPADLLVMAWLQLVLLVDVATVYKANLKSERARGELLDLYGYATGVGPLTRSGPRLLGTIAEALLKKGGQSLLGRAMPLVAAPVTAYLNNQHIQQVGDHAVRFYEGFERAHKKKASGGGKAAAS